MRFALSNFTFQPYRTRVLVSIRDTGCRRIWKEVATLQKRKWYSKELEGKTWSWFIVKFLFNTAQFTNSDCLKLIPILRSILRKLFENYCKCRGQWRKTVINITYLPFKVLNCAYQRSSKFGGIWIISSAETNTYVVQGFIELLINIWLFCWQDVRCKVCKMWAQRGCRGLGEKGQGEGLSFSLLRLRRLLSPALHGGAIRPLGCKAALQSSLSGRRRRQQHFVWWWDCADTLLHLLLLKVLK